MLEYAYPSGMRLSVRGPDRWDGCFAPRQLAHPLAVAQPHDHARNAALDESGCSGVERSR